MDRRKSAVDFAFELESIIAKKMSPKPFEIECMKSEYMAESLGISLSLMNVIGRNNSRGLRSTKILKTISGKELSGRMRVNLHYLALMV